MQISKEFEKMIEIEKKSLITEKEYLFLYGKLQLIPNYKVIKQINYYYDTPNLDLFHKNETLRIRQIDHLLKLQYKCKKIDIGEIRETSEFSKNMKTIPKIIIINNFETNNVGNLFTERMTAKINNCTICLDKNIYFGSIDYELEIEAEKYGDIPGKLYGLSFEKTDKSKYDRFVTKLVEQKDIIKI